jgi:hypothetical protein
MPSLIKEIIVEHEWLQITEEMFSDKNIQEFFKENQNINS